MNSSYSCRTHDSVFHFPSIKAVLLTLLLTLPFVYDGAAATRALPDVPTSAFSVDQVLAAARKAMGKKADAVLLVGVDWCTTSQFQPRYTTGAGYPDLEKKSEEYCWFVTYIDKKADPADRQKFREITVIRIQSDGTARILPSVRT